MKLSNFASVLFLAISPVIVSSSWRELENEVSESSPRNPYLEALRKHPWESRTGYVKVRRDSFMFYWLYYADGTRKGATKKPLIIWIQGGPGLAASGVANFMELGPLTKDMEPRNHTWVKGRNLLLIDHPVGTGFSYTVDDNVKQYARKDKRVAIDLLRCIKGFLARHPEYQSIPTIVASQSYGGKIAPRLVYMLHKAIQKREFNMNLKGVGLGSAFVDPLVISKTLPQYLYHTGIIDQSRYLETRKMMKKLERKVSQGQLGDAAHMDALIFQEYLRNNSIESFLNVAKPEMEGHLANLAKFVNEYVKPTLPVNQNRTWKYESDEVYASLRGNIMLSSAPFVEKLLNNTDLKVVVYNGNLDATCTMAGAVNWVQNLRWPLRKEFRQKARRKIPGRLLGYYKSVGRLSLWWVLNAGHWVPEDNPEAMEHILQFILEDAYKDN